MCGAAPIAYEFQARFSAGESWVTLVVCATEVAAEESGEGRRDVWGRGPLETRVVPVLPLARRL
jgi:hypothetical protein